MWCSAPLEEVRRWRRRADDVTQVSQSSSGSCRTCACLSAVCWSQSELHCHRRKDCAALLLLTNRGHCGTVSLSRLLKRRTKLLWDGAGSCSSRFTDDWRSTIPDDVLRKRFIHPSIHPLINHNQNSNNNDNNNGPWCQVCADSYIVAHMVQEEISVRIDGGGKTVLGFISPVVQVVMLTGNIGWWRQGWWQGRWQGRWVWKDEQTIKFKAYTNQSATEYKWYHTVSGKI